MITREQLLQLADEAGDAVKDLKKRLAAEACTPPPDVVAKVVTTFGKAAAQLRRLDDELRKAAGRDR